MPTTSSIPEADITNPTGGNTVATVDWPALTVEELVVIAQQRAEKPRHGERALEELVIRHQRQVFAALYHLAPERNDLADLTQEVLLRMCRAIGSLRNPKTFKYWLNRIITNLFYDTLRKKTRQIQPSSLDVALGGDNEQGPTRDIPDNTARPDDLSMGSELDQKIHDAINALPEHFRTVVVLREIQGLSYDEIADLTNTQLGTVKSRLARARSRLQETLKPYLTETDHAIINQ
jgi:RNA polymerase sigma-70 factor (ECF subfamily)